MARMEEPENLDFEIEFYEGLLEKNKDFLQALMALGDLYTKKGLYEKGLAIDKKLARMRPEDPYVLYNLACSYSLVNNISKAHQVIKLAIDSGYNDFEFLEQDHDLDNLLHDERFRNYLSQRKQSRNFPQ
jgi:tetratricopeptide (TPR) repeat protein